MTADQIKAMSDKEVNLAIARLCISPLVTKGPPYSTDLNAAWGLMFDGDGNYMCDLQSCEVFTLLDVRDPRRCARLICEAFLYLKSKKDG